MFSRERLRVFYRAHFSVLGASYYIVDARDCTTNHTSLGLARVPPMEARRLLRNHARSEPGWGDRLHALISGTRPLSNGFFVTSTTLGSEARLLELLDAFGTPFEDARGGPDFARFHLLQRTNGQSARRMQPSAPARRRIADALRIFGGKPFVHRGATHHIRLAGDARSPEDARYETLSEGELVSLLRERASEPARDRAEQAAVKMLLDAVVDTRTRGERAELVLMRLVRVVAVAESQAEVLTPSQLREERDEHWLEVVIEDDRLGPLSGEVFEVTLPDGRKQRAITNADGMFRIDRVPAGASRLSLRPTAGHLPTHADSMWSKLELGVTVQADQRHAYTVEHNRVDVVEVDETQFAAGSSVLVPSDAVHAGLDGLSMVAQALRYDTLHSDRTLVIVGHANPSEGDRVPLAEARASAIEALLKGDAKAFAAACVDREQAATPALLAWIHERHGYDCAPDESTEAALARFRRAHNANEGTQLDEAADGMVAADYEAAFLLFDRSLAELLHAPPSELATLRDKLRFHSVPCLAARTDFRPPNGEGAAELRSQTSRRVDLMFFERDRPIPAVDATAVAAEYFHLDERRVRRTYIAPGVSLVVVTPYAGTDIDKGMDAELTLQGPSYTRTIKLSEVRRYARDFFDVKFVEAHFHGVPPDGAYTLSMKPKDGAEHILFENVPIEELAAGDEGD